MSKSKHLADRFREVILSGKWIAYTNLNEQLKDLNWMQATQSIGSLNSIAALCFHLNYYIAGTLEVFEGRDLTIRDKYSWDIPAITSENDWKDLKNKIKINAKLYAAHVETLSDEQLNESFSKDEYGTYQKNISGMIEHCYYHLGQVVVIKKLLLENSNFN